MDPRIVLTLIATLTLTVAGCLGSPGEVVGGDTPQDPSGGSAAPEKAPGRGDGGQREPTERGGPEGSGSGSPELGTFCEDEDSCTFWDDDLHQYILYDMDTYVLDVLVAPSTSAGGERDTAAMVLAIKAWADGIRDLGSSWFADNLTMNVYVLGVDEPPESALRDPEIVVVAAEYNPALLFGIGYQDEFGICRDRGGLERSETQHSHHGMRILRAECKEGGHTCVALNTNFLLGGTNRLYDLVAHEFGHCLGVGHVGDALDFSAKTVPLADIMSYQYNATQVHCVSTMNVRALEGIYAPLLGRPSGGWLNKGSYMAYASSDYDQVSCSNPSS